MTRHYDLIVIGTGPAGQKAAVAAAKAGKSVLAVEKGGMVGGICVHSGTIPSKALREAVLVFAGLRTRRMPGIQVTLHDHIGIDDLIANTAEIVVAETSIVRDQLQRNNIDLVYGEARFDGPHAVRVKTVNDEVVYTGDFIMIAVGATPVRPAHIPFDDDRVLDTASVLGLHRIPKKVVVIGAGVIGVEYACIFAALGATVDLTDRRKELLKFLDREIAEALAYQMWSAGVRLRLGEDAERVEVEGGLVRVSVASGEVIECDTVLYVQGRAAATATLGLDRAGITPGPGGQLKVDANYRTEISHIYAIGDVIGFPSLASTSMEQGRLASCHAFGIPAESFPDLLPYGLYTIPEVSTVGKSASDLDRDGVPYASGRAHYREIARGQLVGDSEGILKLLFHRETRQLLGVHAIGEGATELIHIGQAVLAFNGTINYFVANVFNYPTFAECYRVAALDGINRMMKEPAGGTPLEKLPPEPAPAVYTRSEPNI